MSLNCFAHLPLTSCNACRLHKLHSPYLNGESHALLLMTPQAGSYVYHAHSSCLPGAGATVLLHLLGYTYANCQFQG